MDPFLKWPGGKRWLAQKYESLVPDHSGKYFEPFLGGGAFFFATNPDEAVLSDSNESLINAYKQVRKAPNKIADALAAYQLKHSENFYYEERDCEHESNFWKAVQFIYLNRTCFNGIYRVNLNGRFNVPIGTKTAVVMPNDNFLAVASRLRRKAIRTCGFAESISEAGKNDFVYADPPYTVKHNMNGFVKYNNKLFDWSDQERLQKCLREASDRGTRVLVSNANHASIRSLYAKDWFQYEVSRSSIISADPECRGTTSELLVSNYEIPELTAFEIDASANFPDPIDSRSRGTTIQQLV